MIRRLTLGVVLSVAVSSGALASPSVAIQARMFRRDTGNLDEDIFKGAVKAKLNNLDYGPTAQEMLVDVAIPEGVTGRQLSVTIKQGKLSVAQTWNLSVGRVVGFPVAHHPLLVAPTFCGEPMIITARIGVLVETRTITFTCSD